MVKKLNGPVRVGCVGYATEQGLGRLAKSFYDAGVITEMVVFRHSIRNRVTNLTWYPPDTPEFSGRPFHSYYPDKMWKFLKSVDVVLFFETPFDWTFLADCYYHGVKTVLMPMYEWTPKVWPARPPDAILCPSLLDLEYFHKEFGNRCVFLRVPVDSSKWELRKRADRFLHNAGNIGHREHKGTRQLLEAVPLVVDPEFRLTVRAQDVSALQSILQSVPQATKDPRLKIELGEIPYENLWKGYDVYVAPEKFNGLSLPLQEARAAGMVVMTTDRYPANNWLPMESLIAPDRYNRVNISSNYLDFDEAVVDPAAIAEKIDRWVGRDITSYSLSGKEWAEANNWSSLKEKYLDFFTKVAEERL